MKDNIILCQPDSEKGCSVCCGLFNFSDLSRENLTLFLSKGRERVLKNIDKKNLLPDQETIESDSENGSIRDRTSHICPYQGFIETSQPGCLLHPAINKKDLRNISLFGKKICSSFLCPAHTILTEREKEILINQVNDWFCYSIALIDPESFSWILKEMQDAVSSRLLCECIEIHARYLNTRKETIFFYSVSEYDLAKNGFSLSNENSQMDREKEEIRETIKASSRI
ncbi:MAG: hypothetical protein GY754_29580 [bacterium]|nr:hypothetical protein [bacterium]